MYKWEIHESVAVVDKSDPADRPGGSSSLEKTTTSSTGLRFPLAKLSAVVARLAAADRRGRNYTLFLGECSWSNDAEGLLAPGDSGSSASDNVLLDNHLERVSSHVRGKVRTTGN